jgi:hypothetical protein
LDLRRVANKRRAALEPPFWFFVHSSNEIRLAFDDVDDLVGVRAKNDVPAAHEDEIVSTPFRIDFHDP